MGVRIVNKVEIKAMVHRHKIKITREVIFEMFQLFDKGLDIEWPSPTELGVAKMCKKLVDETVQLRKEAWFVIKMNGRYVQKIGVIL